MEICVSMTYGLIHFFGIVLCCNCRTIYGKVCVIRITLLGVAILTTADPSTYIDMLHIPVLQTRRLIYFPIRTVEFKINFYFIIHVSFIKTRLQRFVQFTEQRTANR